MGVATIQHENGVIITSVGVEAGLLPQPKEWASILFYFYKYFLRYNIKDRETVSYYHLTYNSHKESSILVFLN
jgi:hypothetical protein